MRCVTPTETDTRPWTVTSMKCSHCAQFSEWHDMSSDWERVNEANPAAIRPLLECRQCGHHQLYQ